MAWSETSVLKLRAPEGAVDYTFWDNEVTGFGIRFRAGTDKGTYIVKLRVGTKQRKITLAKVGKITLKAARDQAQEYSLQASRKIDPGVALAKAKHNSAQSLQPLIQPFLDHLQNDKRRSESYVKENKRSLDRYFSALHTFAPDAIDRKTISNELDKIRNDHGPIAMNRARSHLSKFFNWMIGQGDASQNPVTGTNKNDENIRDRLLTLEELANIWLASGGDEQSDKIVRLLILTAARREQICKLRWSEINFAEKCIELPGAVGRSKNKQKYLLPLSRQAIAILKTMDRRANIPFVFGEGEKGFSGHSNAKERVDRILGEQGKAIDDWVFHDFRTAFNTHAQDQLKVPYHIADLLLNHKGALVTRGVSKHYNFATYLDEKVEAMDKWGNFVEQLARPTKPQRKKPNLQLVA